MQYTAIGGVLISCAGAATASIAIHRMETKQIVDSALSPDALTEDCNI